MSIISQVDNVKLALKLMQEADCPPVAVKAESMYIQLTHTHTHTHTRIRSH